MTVRDVELLLSVLVVCVQLLVGGTFLLWIGSLISNRLRAVLDSFAVSIAGNALQIAALFAITAMSGSLYFSNIAHFPPCVLCWYQRICMYPQAVILLIAAIRRDVGIRPYVITLSAIGAVISSYHVQLEKFPDQAKVISCAATGPRCEDVFFTMFGYITIAVMALSGFTGIITMMLLQRRGQRVAADRVAAAARDAESGAVDLTA